MMYLCSDALIAKLCCLACLPFYQVSEAHSNRPETPKLTLRLLAKDLKQHTATVLACLWNKC